MEFSMRGLAGSIDVLAGAGRGRKVLAELVSRTKSSDRVEIVILNFQGVSVATGSFLREAVLGFRDYATAREGLYPVVANMVRDVEEELQFLVNQTSDALWVCETTQSGRIENPRVLGSLDPAEKATFDIVSRVRQTSAPLLAKESKEKISVTAWNNRLASLARKRLLVEDRVGRQKTFRLVLES